MSGFVNEPHIHFMEKDDSGKDEITNVYSRAKHLGCLTGNSPIHPFIWCVSLRDSTPQSLPDSPLAARKTNLTTGDKLPKRSEDFFGRTLQLFGLFSAAQVFSSRTWPPVCFPLSASLDIKEGLKCWASAFATSDRSWYGRMTVVMSNFTDPH